VRPYPVPGYVPAVVRSVLPWTRRHVARVSARYRASVDDLWDEAVTALLRAAIYRTPTGTAVDPARHYFQTAVHRACWRYVIRGHQARPVPVPLEDAAACPELAAPSAEDDAIAREAVRRACILREHAALADARGDTDTTRRLRDAASAAATVARTVRRRPRARA
jgi:hypothetical protein